MNKQQGMANLLAATSLVLVTGMLGWLTGQSVSAETMRSQQQLFAAQALANSEALLETAMATLDMHYATLGSEADTAFWSRASASACPANKPPPVWECLSWPLTELPLPEFIDPLASTVLVIRNASLSPQVATLWVDARFNNMHAGAGSRATVQQSLVLPLSIQSTSNLTPNSFTNPSAKRIQRIVGSWKNAGF